MSRLVGAINTPGPHIDERLVGKLHLLTTIPIQDNIRVLLSQSYRAVAEQLEKEKKLNNILNVICIITPYGDFAIQRDNEQLAYCISHLVIYPIQKWIDDNFNDLKILLFITEELCHTFWEIHDEVRVNYKVLEVMKHIMPELQMENLYNTKWMEENKQ